MIYITGDTHRDFSRFASFFREHKTTRDDIMVILGDVGVNFYDDASDFLVKDLLNAYPITFFCIHGNHEMRPGTIPTYKTKVWHGGTVWYEKAFPYLLFAKDGEMYELQGKKIIVIGGAYSVDKEYRLDNEMQGGGKTWWEDEQPDEETKRCVEERLASGQWKVDYVFSHTCPLRHEPKELFLSFINQSEVDDSTERWLDTIEDRLTFDHWYFGHFHGDKHDGKFTMLFEKIEVLGEFEPKKKTTKKPQKK